MKMNIKYFLIFNSIILFSLLLTFCLDFLNSFTIAEPDEIESSSPISNYLSFSNDPNALETISFDFIQYSPESIINDTTDANSRNFMSFTNTK